MKMQSNVHEREKKAALQEEIAQAQEALGTGRKSAKLEAVARRAYDFWLERGCTHGYDLEDWLRAEAELVQKCIS